MKTKEEILKVETKTLQEDTQVGDETQSRRQFDSVIWQVCERESEKISIFDPKFEKEDNKE